MGTFGTLDNHGGNHRILCNFLYDDVSDFCAYRVLLSHGLFIPQFSLLRYMIQFATFQVVSFVLASSLFIYMLVHTLRIIFRVARPARRKTAVALYKR